MYFYLEKFIYNIFLSVQYTWNYSLQLANLA